MHPMNYNFNANSRVYCKRYQVFRLIARVCSYVGCKLKLIRWLSMRLISSYHESESSFDVYPPKLFITSSEADPPGLERTPKNQSPLQKVSVTTFVIMIS